MAHSNHEILQLFESALAQMNTPEEPELLYSPIIYSMSGGGKRLRPVLLLITLEAFGGNIDEVTGGKRRRSKRHDQHAQNRQHRNAFGDPVFHD